MSAFTSHPDMPAWTPPTTTSELPELNVLNSLTRTKVPFLPMEDGSNAVRWYMCGPTVYDASHMGHARTYLGFDIIKRIMESYFGYDLTLVMNITDIDDKIIKRSAERDIPFTELARHWEEEVRGCKDPTRGVKLRRIRRHCAAILTRALVVSFCIRSS